MDETFDNFLAADPAMGGDVKTLNVPAVRNLSCSPNCIWNRVVASGQNFATDWMVSGQSVIGPGVTIEVTPSQFSLLPRDSDIIFIDGGEVLAADTAVGSRQPVTITVSGVNNDGNLDFALVNFVETEGQTPDARITVAVD